VKKLPRTKWATLSPELLQRGSQQSVKVTERPVHAKLYRFWNQNREILFAGSVNLTNPGFSPGRTGNFEVAAMVESGGDSLHTSWMEPIRDKAPERFLEKASTDEESTTFALGITFRFRWHSNELAYYCEDHGTKPPSRVEISATGSKLFELVKIRFGTWVELPAEDATRVKSILTSTSFLEVGAEGVPRFSVLVQEEGMEHKPSLLRELTAEEILNYWALLSPEQRERFLLQRILTPKELRDEGILLQIEGVQDTMFDRFSGIFHAFNQLERHVTNALEAHSDREAVYRLFGEKYDSFAVLVRKVMESTTEDIVNRYVTLLSAQQFLGCIERKFQDFSSTHRAEFKRVHKSLEGIAALRNSFTFGSQEERAQFFDWFDRNFLVRMQQEAEVGES